MIQVEGISKRYFTGGQEVRALDNVSLTVEDGEFLAIVGSSGSGKSTLMNLLGCLDTPDEGEYYLDACPVTGLKPEERATLRREKLGFVFQSFFLVPRLTALENVELPLLFAGVSRRERRERSLAALEEVGLQGRADHRPWQLSGGQQQRVAVARALVPRPPVLLADEPTGNLDSATGSAVLELLKSQWRRGKTLILITHDPRVAAQAPRNICLENGKLKQ